MMASYSSLSMPTKSICSSLHVRSRCEDDYKHPSEGLSCVAGGIVALGKFDALHIGHRELAIQAARIGMPFLLSFIGMAEVLGWDPRLPIVAKCDRKRILSSWSSHCFNMIPLELEVEFSKVRHLTPRQFVEKLAKELGVRGVVAGENYRFGYKAAGNASELESLCREYGLEAYIIESVMDKNQDERVLVNSNDSKEKGQVSSTRVRHALAKGDIKYVSDLLGRHHRLVLTMKENETYVINRKRVSAPRSCLLNLSPREGAYDNCALWFGDDRVVPCKVVVEDTQVHLELVNMDDCSHFSVEDMRCLAIEFGSSFPI